MRIAVFDYRIVSTSPAGACHLKILDALCTEHEFTVFAIQFDNPRPSLIRWIRVPAPTRPLALLFIIFHVVAPVMYLLFLLKTRRRFDVVQMVESNLAFGSICYCHFCHRVYLQKYWQKAAERGCLGIVKWLDHWLHALVEPHTLRHARYVVVPSRGLQRDLETSYPFTKNKIFLISNPVDVERYRRPLHFPTETFREELGIAKDDVVLCFVALGHFARKGLPVVLEALLEVDKSVLKLLVVGGTPHVVARQRVRVQELGLDKRVIFVGTQPDVRPYLWISDAFILPSAYEAFSLAALEAAAAGLPLIVSNLSGTSEFLRHGENGLLVENTCEGVATGIREFLSRNDFANELGRQARDSVLRFSTEVFVQQWRDFYRRVEVSGCPPKPLH